MTGAARVADSRGRSEPHVELRGISKRFGGIQALHEIDLAIRRGLVHALVGENGAGKSTLGKVVGGLIRPDAGELLVDGQPRHYHHPGDALADGLATIAQELTLVPRLSVLDNVFLGLEPTRRRLVDRRALERLYRDLDDVVGFGLPPRVIAGTLRVADQQKVEILRALAREARLIVMDEPTAALTLNEAERLFEVIRLLRERGTTVIYVSHFLREVTALADDVTVLRDGRLVQTTPAAAQTTASLVAGMLGRSIEVAFPEKRYPAEDAPVVLSVRGLARRGVVEPVDLEVRAGEIVGLAGLIGSGRSELARLICGADRRTSGRIEVDGLEVGARDPRAALRAGIVMLPENRKEQGLLMARSISENVTLPYPAEVERYGLLSRRRERRRARELMEQLDVRAPSPASRVATLSGGNQQKVLFAKCLLKTPRVLVADEPTRGVDVGAKQSIYGLIHSLAERGLAILMISSELEEVLGLAHRVLVMAGGRVVGRFDGRAVESDAVMRAAFATTLEQERPGGVG
jgi:ABC-type sugar transport system ATPase subunit